MAESTAPEVAADEDPCTMMRRVAAETRAEIKRLKDHADALRTLIEKLKAEPQPDQAKIKMLQATLTTVEKQIEDNEASLRDLEDVIRENC